MQIRRAAATAREALLGRAAQQLRRATARAQRRRRRRQSSTAGGERVATRSWSAAAQFDAQGRPEGAAEGSPKDYTIVGKSVAAARHPGQDLRHASTYMQDFKVPGMLHARMVHPPGVRRDAAVGQRRRLPRRSPATCARCARATSSPCVARNEWAAIRRRTTIEAKWSDWAGLPDAVRSCCEYVRSQGRQVGRRPEAPATRAARVADRRRRSQPAGDLRLRHPTRTARSARRARSPSFKDGQLTVWTAVAGDHLLRKQLATMLGMSRRHVRCIYVEGAGCYGRNGARRLLRPTRR